MSAKRQVNVRLPAELVDAAKALGPVSEQVEKGLRVVLGWDNGAGAQAVLNHQATIDAVNDHEARISRLEAVAGL